MPWDHGAKLSMCLFDTWGLSSITLGVKEFLLLVFPAQTVQDERENRKKLGTSVSGTWCSTRDRLTQINQHEVTLAAIQSGMK